MSERGVFAMDRGWFNHPAFAAEPYTEREAWASLISQAAYRAHKRRVGKFLVEVQRGQVAASIRFLAEKWGWHRAKVERFLKRLTVHEMIATAARHGIGVITICNYDKYQRVALPSETQTETVARQYRDKEESQEYQEIDAAEDDARANPSKSDPLVSPEAIVLADEITRIVGHDPKFVPPTWCGAAMHVAKWLRRGWHREIILVAVRASTAKKRDGPPGRITYFEKPIAEEIARQAAPLPSVKIADAQEITLGGSHGAYRGRGGPIQARNELARRRAVNGSADHGRQSAAGEILAVGGS